MPIRWKVTTKDRGSAIVTSLAKSYSLHYRKNKLVEAHKNSLGIAVFEKKKQAIAWRNQKLNGKRGLVLKVDAKGRGTRPKVYIPCIWGPWSMTDSFRKIEGVGLLKFLQSTYSGWITPKGTLLYKEVMVLE